MEDKAERIMRYVDEKEDFEDFPDRKEYNELLREYGVVE